MADWKATEITLQMKYRNLIIGNKEIIEIIGI